MWRILYRLLAWMSGGPTIEVADDWETRYFQMLDNYWTSSTREARLSEQLGDAHAKITELESDCDSFCEAIDGLLKKQKSLKKELEDANESVRVYKGTVNYAVKILDARDATITRWQTACNTMQQQRDEALEHLAAIQEQTAKYVGH